MICFKKVKSRKMENLDIHIHVPAGAIPKDGPSAGIAIASALVSALTDQAVDRNVAMTGEISLRGRVLPIGGLKEKSLGALRAGIHRVVIPDRNKRDLDEIPSVIKRKLKYILVSNMDDVLDISLIKKPKKTPARKKSGTKKAAAKRK